MTESGFVNGVTAQRLEALKGEESWLVRLDGSAFKRSSLPPSIWIRSRGEEIEKGDKLSVYMCWRPLYGWQHLSWVKGWLL